MTETTKFFTLAALTFGAACAANAQFTGGRPPTAVLPIAQNGGYGIDYKSANRVDFLALVRPIGGGSEIRPLPLSQGMWFASQEFEVLDSPDFQGSTVTAYYYVHPVRNLNGGLDVPAQLLPLDEGKYLLVGRKHESDTVQFDFAVDLAGSNPFTVEPPEELNVTITGLFAVKDVSWAEGGPRWRFVYETIAVNMAHARAGALGDITFAINRLHGGTEPPQIPGENLYGSERSDAQAARFGDIVRTVIEDTEATATAQDKVYYLSVLVHYEQSKDVEAFIDAVHKLIVDEEGEMPESFEWPRLQFTAADKTVHGLGFGYSVPRGEYQVKLLDIAEETSSARSRGSAMSNARYLEGKPSHRRFFALINDQTPTARVLYYQRLIDWRNITGIEIEVERSRGGSDVRILNETAVRARIEQSLRGRRSRTS